MVAIALIDCNNFYASCEQVFDVSLRNRPVIVLSNNDGNVIARNSLAKELGIKMGEPLFQIRHLVQKHNIALLSSNYSLYGDMSDRLMTSLDYYSPEIERYSIDEAFIDLSHVPSVKLTDIGQDIRKSMYQWTGLPVSVGVGSTKVLSKAANYHAKRSKKANGVVSLVESPYVDLALERVPIEEVWGIGPAYSEWLKSKGIYTALSFRDSDERMIRQKMGVVGVRLVHELRGIPCLPLDLCPADPKSITVSRSFPEVVRSLSEIKEALANFTTRAAEKLRRRGMVARTVTVFIATSKFSQEEQYADSKTIELAYATDITTEILSVALRAVELIYREGKSFKKVGVILSGLIPARQLSNRLWDQEHLDKMRRVMEAVDRINTKYGRDTVRFAVMGYKQRWQTRFAFMSPRYTTCWNELMEVP
jgi:DNA polymerase V